MPISVVCPTCGTKLKAPDDAVGKKVKCPKCASLIPVSESGEAETGVSNAPAPEPNAAAAEDQVDQGEDIPEAADDLPPDETADEGEDEAGGEGEGEEGRPKKKKKKGQGGPLREDDKTWGLFAHLAGAFFGWLGALIVMLMKKDESAFLRHHTKESMNFQITMIIGWLVAFLCTCCFSFGGCIMGAVNEWLRPLANCISTIPWMAFIALNLVLTIMQGLKAKNGEWSKYPFAIRLIK